jgi:hypothetical protein
MRRRELLLALTTGMIGARAVRAQQKAMPVVGYLSQRSPTDSASIVAAFRQGLKEEGYAEGQTSPSNLALRKDKSIACRRWRAIWFDTA